MPLTQRPDNPTPADLFNPMSPSFLVTLPSFIFSSMLLSNSKPLNVLFHLLDTLFSLITNQVLITQWSLLLLRSCLSINAMSPENFLWPLTDQCGTPSYIYSWDFNTDHTTNHLFNARLKLQGSKAVADLFAAILLSLTQGLESNGALGKCLLKVRIIHKCQDCNWQVKAAIFAPWYSSFGISSGIFLFRIFKKVIEIVNLKIQNWEAEPELWTFYELLPSMATSGNSYCDKRSNNNQS